MSRRGFIRSRGATGAVAAALAALDQQALRDAAPCPECGKPRSNVRITSPVGHDLTTEEMVARYGDRCTCQATD